MFKNLLSALTVMLVMFSMNAGAQNLQKENLGDKSVAKNVMTSKLNDLKGTEKWMGYWDGTMIADNSYMIGASMVPFTYGVAIGYPAGSEEMAGKTIEGIRFGFLEDTNIEYIRVFIATQLPELTGRADVCMDYFGDGLDNGVYGIVEGDVVDWNEHWNEVRFRTPYTVDPGKPVYIGYIFQVVEPMNNKQPELPEIKPILTKANAGVQSAPGSLFINLGGQLWEDGAANMLEDSEGNKFGVQAAIQVLVSGGDVTANDVVIKNDLGTMIGTKGSCEIPVSVSNLGSNGITSLELETNINGVKTTCQAVPEKPIKGTGAEFAFNLTVNTPNEAGNFDYTVKVTKINGAAVTKDIVGKGKMIILTRNVRHKVFFEEFTGMWCMACPYGHVAMEKLHKMYGDNVVRVAIHFNDPLAPCEDYTNFAINTTGGNLPVAHVDRRIVRAHPYGGTSSDIEGFGISKDVEACMNIVPVAEIISKPIINGDKLTATADVKFLFSGNASDYAVGFILTEDGISDPQWNQKNGLTQFKGQGLDEIEPMLAPWINGEESMPCVYNSVVHDAIGVMKGLYGTIPMTVKAEETVSSSVEFDLSKYKNIKNRDNLCVAVVLFNRNGEGVVVNSDIAPVNPSASGIENVSGSNNVVETARYTIDGRRIHTAEKGINIVKYSDGTVKKLVVE